jgi:radical SAM protein with 4Fe4S-binding SPASM domain
MKINFESSTACNAKCTFCPRYDMTRQMGNMSDETFHKIIKDGKEMGVTNYSPFMNGEPFVFPKIWEWLDYMEKEGVTVSLYTNAEHIDVDRIIKYKNIKYINCSVNASTEETYNKIMRGPDYKKVVKNTNELFEKAPFLVRASLIKNELNANEVEDFNYPKVKIEQFDNWTGDRESEFERKGKKVPCYVLFKQMFVLWNGDVVPCCMDYDGKQILGNVNDNTLKEIWDYSKWMRNKHTNKDFDTFVCRNCNYNTI